MKYQYLYLLAKGIGREFLQTSFNDLSLTIIGPCSPITVSNMYVTFPTYKYPSIVKNR